MAAARTLEVTFLGNPKPLQDAMHNVEVSSGQLDDKVGGLGSKFEAVGKAAAVAFAAAGAAAVGGLAVSVNAAANFEHAIDQVGAVANATSDEMDGLSDAALRIGKDTAFSATEAAQAMEILAANGVSARDIMDGAADATVALAAAGGTDLKTAADVASTAMSVWNIQAKDMTEVVNRLAGAANVSRFGVEDMAGAVAMGGGAAKLAGVDFGDFTTVIAATANSFSSGSDAGTSFKQFLNGLTPSTKSAQEAFQQLGLTTSDGSNRFFDAKGNLKSMAEVTEILHGATANLSEEQKSQALTTIFGTDAVRMAGAVSALTGDQIAGMSEKMRTTDAAAVAAQRMGNFKGSLEALKGSLETIEIEIGLKLLPVLTRLANYAAEALPLAFDWLEKHLAPIFSDIIAPAVEDVARKAGELAAIGWEKLQGAWDAIAPVLKRVAALTWEGLQALASASWDRMQSAWESISEKMGGIPWGKLKDEATDTSNWASAWAAVRDAVQPAIEFLRPLVEGLLNDLKDQFNQVKEALGPLLEALAKWEPILKPVAEIIGVVVVAAIAALLLSLRAWVQFMTITFVAAINVATAIIESITVVVGAVSKAVSEWPGEIGGFLSDLLGRVKDFVSGVKSKFDDMLSGVKDTWDSVTGATKTAWDTVTGIFDTAWSTVSGWLSASWSTVKEKLINPINDFLGLLKTGMTDLWGAISDMWTTVSGWIDSSWSTVKEKLINPINDFLGLLKTGMTDLWGAISDMWTTVSGWIDSSWSTVEDKLTSPITGAVKALANIGADFLAIGGNIIGGIVNGIGAAASTVRDAVWDAKDWVLKNLGTVTDWLVGVAWDIVRGLAGGLWAARQVLLDGIKTLVNLIPEEFRSLLHINSPSRVMAREVGQPISAGVAQGILEGIPGIEEALRQVAETVVSFDPGTPGSGSHTWDPQSQGSGGPGGGSMPGGWGQTAHGGGWWTWIDGGTGERIATIEVDVAKKMGFQTMQQWIDWVASQRAGGAGGTIPGTGGGGAALPPMGGGAGGMGGVGGAAGIPVYSGIPPSEAEIPIEIPAMAAGGIVRKPTLALVGESGPEAVVPLDRGAVGGEIHIHVSALDAPSFEGWLSRGGADVILRQLNLLAKRAGRPALA